MPVTVTVKDKSRTDLQYDDLRPGDVFTWGQGAHWYLKVVGGYVPVDGSSGLNPDARVKAEGAFKGCRDLRRAKEATLTIEV